MSKRNRILRTYQLGGLIAWLVFFFITFYSVIEGGFNQPHVNKYVSTFYRDITLNLFILFAFLYFRLRSEKPKSHNFNDLLWDTFMTAALMVIALVLNQQFAYIDINLFDHILFKNIVYEINGVFLIIFCGKTFYTYKNLILYQKTKALAYAWNIYEGLLLICLLISHFEIDHFHLSTMIFVGVLALYGLVLSLNMKWIAYLNFKQKLRGTLLLSIILVITCIFIHYLYSTSHLVNLSRNQTLVNDISQHFFLIIILIFVIFYCISSILVILFNLPTSSVFEQKLSEVFNFQKLAQTIRATKSEKEIYDVLLDISTNTTLADASWLEINNTASNTHVFLNHDIDKVTITTLYRLLKHDKVNIDDNFSYIADINKLTSKTEEFSKSIKCFVTFPIFSGTTPIGFLGLVKYIKEGFNSETIEVIQSFVNQACISIENSQLLNEAIKTERYKEEIKIAKKIQQHLLPKQLEFDKKIEISAFSMSADDVGGDYYDTFNISQDQIGIVIGDVSGHGTSAAFNMAQVKGVFQALILTSTSTSEILVKANKALSNCLEGKSFVTLTIVIINLKNKTFDLSRAGHCPTLFYEATKNLSTYFNTKGLGLGILRDDSYVNHIETITHSFHPGDMMLLYTDGAIETKNDQAEEYGYERLLTAFEQNTSQPTDVLIEKIKHNVLFFNKKQTTEDDFSLFCIKFI